MSHYCENKTKTFFRNIYQEEVTDNRKFWQTVKPLLFDKVKYLNTPTLVKVDEIFSKYDKGAKANNQFISNVVQNLDIPDNQMKGSFHENLKSHPFLKSVLVTLSSRNSIKIYQFPIFLR